MTGNWARDTQRSIAQSAALTTASAPALAPRIAQSAELILQSLEKGGQLLACGNGGSFSDATHFVAELVGHYRHRRRALPAITLGADGAVLTALANDFGYEQAYARELQALGRPGDVLVAISTSGNSANVCAAVAAAQRQGLVVIALTGRDGGRLGSMLRSQDVELRAASEVTARIQELHILCLHCICELLDNALAPAASAGPP